MLRPRKPLIFVFLPLFLLSGYLALVYELSLIHVAFCLLGVMTVLSALLAWLGLRGLAARRRHPHEVMAGQPFEVRVAIENRTPALSSMFFTVEDALQREHEANPRSTAVLSLVPAEEAVVTYRARVERRGEYRLSDVKLSSRFPFGAWEKRATLKAATTLLVLPRPGRLRHDVVREEPAVSAEHPVPVRGGIGEFHGVREFQWGDNPRHVHWATSARKGGTWVREYEREIDRRLLIVLDAAPHPAFERAVTMCATLADHYLARPYRVALALVAARPAWVPFGAGADHRTRLLRALATVREEDGPRVSQWDTHDVRGAQIAVVGASVPAGLAALGASVTRIDPADPALEEIRADEPL